MDPDSEPLNIICRGYHALLREAIVKNRDYKVYRDIDTNTLEIDIATTRGESINAPWNWNITIKKTYDPIGDIPYYLRRLYMRVVFGDNGAWLSWHDLPQSYLGLVQYIPRLKKLAQRHFRHTLLEYRVFMPEAETVNMLPLRHNQFVMNGRVNYEYCSEKSMSYLVPDTIIALRAFEELFGMNHREYERAASELARETGHPFIR